MNRQPACPEPCRKAPASILVICALIASCTTSSVRDSERETAGALDSALAAEHRSASAARDRYRHPKETLLFFGIRPDMTVVEIWPASGWYTEILAPLLRERGTLYAAHLDTTEGDYARAAVERFKSWLAQRPDLYDRVGVTALGGPGSTSQIAPPGAADLVVTFRNLHKFVKP